MFHSSWSRGIAVLLLISAPRPAWPQVDSRELRWAGDPEGGAPFVEASPTDPDTLVGFDVEIADLIARGLGRTPRFVLVSFAYIDQSIARGDADIGLSGIEDTPARRSTLSATVPYTVIENICLAPMHVQRQPAADAAARARELMQRLGVEHCAAALPRELSGGEAQRVAIARALAMDPPVLLMDEPTASLDAARRQELAAVVKGLAGRNRTLLIATHDEDFARAVATRVLRISEGVVREDE
jgi:ABC-type taurine transport system ATPase subunit